MEKHHQITNFTLIHHLPGIINILQIVNLMMYGFVISQPMFFVMALHSLQKTIKISPKRTIQNLWNKITGNLQVVYAVVATLIVFSFIFIDRSAENTLVVTLILASLILLTRLLPLGKNNMPANQGQRCWL